MIMSMSEPQHIHQENTVFLQLVPTSWVKIVKTLLVFFFPSPFLFPSYTSYRFFVVLVCYFSVLNVYYCFCFQRSFKDQARCQRKKRQCRRRSTQESMTRGSCLRWSRYVYIVLLTSEGLFD